MNVVVSADLINVEVMIEAPHWDRTADCERTVRRAIAAASQGLRPGEVTVVLTDDAAIRELNRDWRGVDKPTNVLSFPALQPQPDGVVPLLGDIVIAHETVAAEAQAEGKPFLDHLAHLTVHGFLHLIGQDHQTDAEADAMEAEEIRILAGLGIPDPYSPRAAS